MKTCRVPKFNVEVDELSFEIRARPRQRMRYRIKDIIERLREITTNLSGNYKNCACLKFKRI